MTLKKTCRNLLHDSPPRTKINVCGHIYEIYTGILDAYPETLLGDPSRREKYRLNNAMLFFHRHPSLFSYILYYHIQGFVQKPRNIPSDIFIEECRFFSIPFDDSEVHHPSLHYEQIQKEEPTSNKFFQFIAFFFSILSCIILFFNHLPKSDLIANQLLYNSLFANSLDSWIDMICTVWFMIEYFIRYFFYRTNEHFHFFIDLISIAPIFLSLLTNSFTHWFPYLTLLYPFYICLKSFRVLRFIRYIPHFELIIRTFTFSFNHFSISLFLCSLFIIPFGLILYLIESTDPHSNITDANIGLSWAIETLTTIGYGEYIPHTYQGRSLAIFACIFGLVILALPIPIVFRTFEKLHENALKGDLWRRYV